MSAINSYLIRPNIYVYTSDTDFLDHVEFDLRLLESREVGERLITKIGRSEHPVYIFEGLSDETVALDGPAACTRGQGCSSRISYSLKNFLVVDSKGTQVIMPIFLKLAHELIHAYRASHGKWATKPLSIDTIKWWSNREEVHTIKGFPSQNPSRNMPKISENAIREEHGYPERFGHITPEHVSTNEFPSLGVITLAQRTSDVFFKTLANPYSPTPIAGISRMVMGRFRSSTDY